MATAQLTLLSSKINGRVHGWGELSEAPSEKIRRRSRIHNEKALSWLWLRGSHGPQKERWKKGGGHLSRDRDRGSGLWLDSWATARTFECKGSYLEPCTRQAWPLQHVLSMSGATAFRLWHLPPEPNRLTKQPRLRFQLCSFQGVLATCAPNRGTKKQRLASVCDKHFSASDSIANKTLFFSDDPCQWQVKDHQPELFFDFHAKLWHESLLETWNQSNHALDCTNTIPDYTMSLSRWHVSVGRFG